MKPQDRGEKVAYSTQLRSSSGPRLPPPAVQFRRKSAIFWSRSSYECWAEVGVLSELVLVEVTIEFGLGMEGLGSVPAREADEVAVDIGRGNGSVVCVSVCCCGCLFEEVEVEGGDVVFVAI